MENVKQSEILKYYFRYAVIGTVKITNIKCQMQSIISLSYAMASPIIDEMAKTTSEVVYMFDTMIETISNLVDRDTKVKAEDVMFVDPTIKKLIDALNTLLPFERQIIILYDIEMMSNKQIAELYGVNVGETGTMLYYLRRELAKIYAQLWPFADENDIKGLCEKLNEIRQLIDTQFVLETIMEM